MTYFKCFRTYIFERSENSTKDDQGPILDLSAHFRQKQGKKRLFDQFWDTGWASRMRSISPTLQVFSIKKMIPMTWYFIVFSTTQKGASGHLDRGKNWNYLNSNSCYFLLGGLHPHPGGTKTTGHRAPRWPWWLGSKKRSGKLTSTTRSTPAW